jgi:hypothetical protein
MELIRTLKEKNNTKRLANIRKLAQEVISLSDFDNEIFIAYNGTPLIPVNKEWTTKEIIEELSVVRENFVNCRLKENGLPKVAAAL